MVLYIGFLNTQSQTRQEAWEFSLVADEFILDSYTLYERPNTDHDWLESKVYDRSNPFASNLEPCQVPISAAIELQAFILLRQRIKTVWFDKPIIKNQ